VKEFHQLIEMEEKELRVVAARALAALGDICITDPLSGAVFRFGPRGFARGRYDNTYSYHAPYAFKPTFVGGTIDPKNIPLSALVLAFAKALAHENSQFAKTWNQIIDEIYWARVRETPKTASD